MKYECFGNQCWYLVFYISAIVLTDGGNTPNLHEYTKPLSSKITQKVSYDWNKIHPHDLIRNNMHDFSCILYEYIPLALCSQLRPQYVHLRLYVCSHFHTHEYIDTILYIYLFAAHERYSKLVSNYFIWSVYSLLNSVELFINNDMKTVNLLKDHLHVLLY